MAVKRGRSALKLVAIGRAGLEAAVEHAFALMVIVFLSVGSIPVAALIEAVLGAVVEQRNGHGGVEKGHGRLEFGHVIIVVAAHFEGDAVDVVVVDECNQTVGAFAVLADVVALRGQLSGTAVVFKHTFDGARHRKEKSRIERIALILTEAGQRTVVIAEQLAKQEKIAFAERCRMHAHIVGPLLAPVIFNVLDGIDAESVAVCGRNQVFERQIQLVLHIFAFRRQIIGALKLAQQILRGRIPVNNRSIMMKPVQTVERAAMAA